MRVKVIFAVVLTTILPATLCFPSESYKQPNASSDTPTLNYPTLRHQSSYRSDELTNQQAKSEEPKSVKKEKSIVTIEEERFPSLDELREKCQHFSRLFGLNQYGSGSIEGEENGDYSNRRTSSTMSTDYYNRPVIEVTRRPVFIRNKATFIEKGSGGFYVTASSIGNPSTTTRKPVWSTAYSKILPPSTLHTTTTPKPTTTASTETVPESTTLKSKIKVKYTKFEPVILQKTILTDGRVMYHWHKSLPTASVDLAEPLAVPPAYEYPPRLPLGQRNLGSNEGVPIEVTTKPTTTTEKSSWLFVPFSNFFGGSHEEESTTDAVSTTTTSTTTSKPPEDPLSTPKPILRQLPTEPPAKAAELKLVVPIHYDNIDSTLGSQSERFGFYRPPAGATNEPVSSSSLHVIKTVGMPQHIPRYSLGYTGSGYGLTYGGLYSPEFLNYQGYEKLPLNNGNDKLAEVSV
ncbi:uncharacterized protein LOC109537054 [Dendroctonus ponderosae]|uniref:DUF4794 domain-containing protein n=1 Tax=Dendroctonus ponderosae TaxID=77166 RepID=A0AAR5PDK1_DENPD|nr:uncharacterized protein LOC109537054 [Dendroctonus ponderosae]KAH1011435.1 hypothetical protein HUJ04_000806 [Dendroctonus ponderosae]KAH1018677.1 hypothetical protein HUJ05_006402 [Dendroctonus ponderosae]